MKILFCYTRFPWPTNKGDSLTVFKMLEFLSKDHEVDFLTVKPTDTALLRFLPKQLRRVITVPNPMPRRLLRLASSLPTNRCLQIDSFFDPAYGAIRNELLQASNYDIVYSHYIRSFGHDDFDGCGAHKVIGLQLSHQAHFAKSAKTEKNTILRWLYSTETKRLEYWESKVAGLNDLIHLISHRDLDRIKNHDSWRSRVFFNPHGVDPQEFAPAPDSKVRGRLVFTGNLGFQANVDAVLWLVREIWPRVLNACPSAELVVAGARPTSTVRAAVASATNGNLVAFPNRMADVLQTGDVAIDPLRVGAGLQNKILEAMSCGLPVVATRLANEGIGAREDHEIILADSVESLATAVVNLIVDRKRNREVGLNARDFIERSWSWEHHFDELEDRWMELADNAVAVE